jgi:hypothetical protein
LWASSIKFILINHYWLISDCCCDDWLLLGNRSIKQISNNIGSSIFNGVIIIIIVGINNNSVSN